MPPSGRGQNVKARSCSHRSRALMPQTRASELRPVQAPNQFLWEVSLESLIMPTHCEFCQIIRGEQPARIVGETSDTLAFFPLKPVCLGHTLVIPKTHVSDLWSADDSLSASLIRTVIRIGRAINQALQPDGMNVISSAGEAASQTIFHLHLHVVPRWAADRIGNIWPPSEPWSGEMKDETAALIRDAYAAISAGPR
jgi:histidine triad (HIT) family protein